MPALHTQSELMTLQQYEALSEDIKIEVFDGVVYNMTSPSQDHQTILTELLVSLRNYIREKKGNCFVFPAPFDVKLNDTPLTIVQPDLMVICDKKKLDGKRCNGAPDFIIEIVSPSNYSHDYVRKLNLYMTAGVLEYWIVNPVKQTVFVYHLDQKQFEVSTYTFQDKIKVNIFDDLYINFSEIAALLF